MSNNDSPMTLEQLDLNIGRLNRYLNKPSTTEAAKAWYRQEIQRLESEKAKLLGEPRRLPLRH
jgi:hypothetical protein